MRYIMATPRLLSGLLFISALGLAGCSDDAGPSFTGPNIAGNWNGTWRSTQLLLALQQTGDQVSGLVTLEGGVYDLTGVIDEFGIFRFSAVNQDPNTCQTLGSSNNHIAVTGSGTGMDGSVRRSTPTGEVGDPCGGPRILVEVGTLLADRV